MLSIRSCEARCILTTLAIALAAGTHATAGDTVGWRTDGTGRYPDARPPARWSATSGVAWKVGLPDWGNASPVVVGGRAFVCAEPATLICIDLERRRIAWQKANDDLTDRKPKTHSTNGYSSYTPVSDGRRVYVAYGLGVVACCDLEGNRTWGLELAAPDHAYGGSTSPILVGGLLVVRFRDLVALDPATGRERWRVKTRQAFGTPVIVELDGVLYVVSPRGDIIRAADGRLVAKDIFGPDADKLQHRFNSPVINRRRVYMVDGYNKQKVGMAACVELPATARELDAGNVRLVWTNTQLLKDRYYASPVYHDGLVYSATKRGQVVVLDASTGAVVYVERVRLGGTVYPSLCLAGNAMYLGSDSGRSIFFEPGRRFEEISRCELEKYRGTPVFAGGTVYVRGMDNFYVIAAHRDQDREERIP